MGHAGVERMPGTQCVCCGQRAPNCSAAGRTGGWGGSEEQASGRRPAHGGRPVAAAGGTACWWLLSVDSAPSRQGQRGDLPFAPGARRQDPAFGGCCSGCRRSCGSCLALLAHTSAAQYGPLIFGRREYAGTVHWGRLLPLAILPLYSSSLQPVSAPATMKAGIAILLAALVVCATVAEGELQGVQGSAAACSGRRALQSL